MINLYKKGLFLSLFGFLIMLIAGNVSDIKFIFELKPILYIISGISFSVAFTFFSIVYLKSQSQNSKKRKALRKV